MPLPSTYELGENWWNAYQDISANPDFTGDLASMQDYWDNVFDEFITPEYEQFGLSPEMVLLEYGSYLPYNIDPSEMYRVRESDEMQRDLLESTFKLKTRPEEAMKIGSSGLAMSGYNPLRDPFDIYQSDMEDISFSTDAAISDLYTSFGSSLTNQLGTLGQLGAFYADADYMTNMEENYANMMDETWWDEDISFQENLEACVNNYLSGDAWNEVPSVAEYNPALGDPNAYAAAVYYCANIG